MPHVSKRKLSEETLKILDDAIVSILSKNSNSETRALLPTLLTDTEKVMIAKRLGILFLLNKDQGESHIAEALHITPLTVMRTKLKVAEGNPEAYSLLFRKLEKWERFNIFKGALLDLAKFAAKKLARGARF